MMIVGFGGAVAEESARRPHTRFGSARAELGTVVAVKLFAQAKQYGRSRCTPGALVGCLVFHEGSADREAGRQIEAYRAIPGSRECQLLFGNLA
jgi:hypothetical protein